MELPKYILGDNTDFPNAIFVIHTEFPRFIINLENDILSQRSPGNRGYLRAFGPWVPGKVYHFARLWVLNQKK